MGESSDTPFSEHRRFPRYPCKGGAEILKDGTRWGRGSVNEISRGGCYITTAHPLPVGSETHLRLTIADTSLDIYASVISADPLVGMGMAFVRQTRQQRNKLAQIAEKVTATAPLPFELQTGAHTEEEGRSHLQAALQHLQQAKEEIREGMPDKAEHRENALQSTDNAISEVEKSMGAEPHLETIESASTEGEVVWQDELLGQQS